MSRRLLLGAALPVALLIGLGRLWRLLELAPSQAPADAAEWLICLLPGPFLWAGLAGLCLAAMRSPWPRLALAASQLLWSALGLYSFTALAFSFTTGSSLPASVIAYALRHTEDVFAIVNSEVSPARFGALLAIGLLPLLLPAAIRPGGPPPPLPLCLFIGFAGLFGAQALPALSTDRERAAEPVFALIEALGPAPARAPRPAQTTAPARAARRSGAPAENLVVILLESTGYQATSLDPNGPATTPFLAQLAAQNTQLTAAQVVIPHTSKALVASLCGVSPAPTVQLPEVEPGGIPSACLAGLLGPLGYQTLYLQGASGRFESRYQLIENLGFARFLTSDMLDPNGFAIANYFGVEDAILLDPLARFLDEEGDGPFFLALLTNTPHHDYQRITGFPQQAFDPRWDAHDRYLNAVAYQDHFLARVFAALQDRGLLDDTVVMVLGDHGEGFLEHGRNEHDNVPYGEVLHIPWVIVDPGRPPTRIEAPVSQLDLLPTALDLLDIDLVEGSAPGRSVYSDLPASRPLFFHCWYEKRCAGVRQGDWRFIHRFGWSADELYHLAADPAERQNQAATPPPHLDGDALAADVIAHWAGVAAGYGLTAPPP